MFILYDGVAYGFPDQDALLKAKPKAFDEGEIKYLSEAEIDAFPKAPPNGTYVQDGFKGYLYVVHSGVKFRLNESEFRRRGATADQVRGVPWRTIEGVPSGGPLRWYSERLGPRTARLLARFYGEQAVRWRSLLEGAVIGALVSLLIGSDRLWNWLSGVVS